MNKKKERKGKKKKKQNMRKIKELALYFKIYPFLPSRLLFYGQKFVTYSNQAKCEKSKLLIAYFHSIIDLQMGKSSI